MENVMEQENKEKMLGILKKYDINVENLNVATLYEESKKKVNESEIFDTQYSIIINHSGCIDIGQCTC
jgi:hypothetical protein